MMKGILRMMASLGLAGCVSVNAAEGVAVLENFSQLDAWQVWPEAWGGQAEFVAAPGPEAGMQAIRFSGPGIVYRELADAGAVGWERATGLSFWVKGDGSPLYGTIVVGPAGQGSWQQGFVNAGMTGHAFYFPLANTNWHRVTASWSDFIPEGPHPAIGTPGGLAPSGIRVLRFGNRWMYWRNYEKYPRFSYEIACVEMVAAAQSGTPATRPAAVDEVLARMAAGEPVRILCVGDSITAGAGTTGDKRYWVLLEKQLRAAFNNDKITVEGWGIGGATLLDALPWIDWMLGKDPPDLLTLMFGTNDCSCYDPAFFRWCVEEFLTRTARASGGKTAVLPFATLPGLKDYATKTDPYAEAVRQVMRERNQPFLDLSAAFKALEPAALQACFADGVHLNPEGNAFVCETIRRLLAANPTEPAQP